MPNLSGGGQNQNLWTPWMTDANLRTPAAIPASSPITFYTSQACMRDGNGNIIQCDDTVKGEFVGFLQQIFNQTVQPTELIYQNGISGDEVLECIFQPQRFFTQLANVVAGQEGLKVYWQFNNQVQFVPGNNGNFAGTIWQVFDSTHAWIMPPWLNRGLGQGGVSNSVMTLSGSQSYTLTKWDVNRTFEVLPTAATTIILPNAGLCSPGDRITFYNMGGTAQVITLDGFGTQTINGGATTTIGTAQYSRITVETDGTQWLIASV